MTTSKTKGRKGGTTTTRATAATTAKRGRASTSRTGGASKKLLVLVATRKGAFLLRGDAKRSTFKVEGPHFLGHVVHHMVLDPRDQRTMLVSVRTGHLGPTVFRTEDMGKTWKEATTPPRFARVTESNGRAVDHVFWLTPGHVSEPGVWYAGTSPQGLFRSEDGGRSWDGVKGLNDHPMLETWTGGAKDGTPDGPKLHSVLIDPRNPRRMYVGMSSGGVFTSDDQGLTWRTFSKGLQNDFLPDPDAEWGHDPHNVALHPLQPDRLYQQNHCGIYRMDRPDDRWVRVGRKMPKDIGDIGFSLVVHPRDPKTFFVFPMDGSSVWPRVSPGGKPAVYVSRDAGGSFRRLDRGLPRSQAWFTVKRQAFTCDDRTPLGLYFGTTSGEVWASRNEGASWVPIASHLPHIYALETATP